jgi:hypothetical protein
MKIMGFNFTMVFINVFGFECQASAKAPEVAHEARRLGRRNPATRLQFLVPLEDFDDFKPLVKPAEQAIPIPNPYVVDFAADASQGHVEPLLPRLQTPSGVAQAPHRLLNIRDGALQHFSHTADDVLDFFRRYR